MDITRALLISSKKPPKTAGIDWGIAKFREQATAFGSGGGKYVYCTTKRDTELQIYYSTNKTNWNIATIPESLNENLTSMNDVVWNGLYYVAVGQGGRVLVSSDAITWTLATSNTTWGLNRVTWNGTNFIAVGVSGAVITAPSNPTTWTARTTGVSTSFNAVASNGTIHVIAGQSGAIYTSTDFVTWMQRTSTGTDNFNYGLYCPRASGSKFLLTGGLHGVLHTSSDGITWAATTSVGNPFFRMADSGNTVAIASSNNNVYTTTDFSTLTLRTNSHTGINDVYITWTGSEFVRSGNGKFMSSSNVTTWTNNYTGPFSEITDIAKSTTTYVAVSTAAFTGNSPVISSSTDGINWVSRVERSGGTSMLGVLWTGTQFIVVGNSGTIYTSLDGIQWTSRTSGTTQPLFALASNGSLYVAVGDASTILTSTDGTTWTVRTAPASYNIRTITYGAGTFIAGTSSGYIYKSTDGINWTSSYSGTSTNFRDSAYANGKFVLVTDGGRIVHSADGTSWTIVSTDSLNTFTSVEYGNGYYVIVGYQSNRSVFGYSTDLVSFSDQRVPTTTYPMSLLFDGTKFIAGGRDGATYHSLLPSSGYPII